VCIDDSDLVMSINKDTPKYGQSIVAMIKGEIKPE
jgi:hypothetical protein